MWENCHDKEEYDKAMKSYKETLKRFPETANTLDELAERSNREALERLRQKYEELKLEREQKSSGSPRRNAFPFPPHDPIQPHHYTKFKYEPIEVFEDWFPADPLLWQVGKYIVRAKHKGHELEDLKKARFYLNRKIKHLESHLGTPSTEANQIVPGETFPS